MRHGTLTTTNGETYEYSGDGNTILVTAPDTNTGGSIREFYWQDDRPYYPDQESCMTWDTPTGTVGNDIIQPGLAMRIAPSGPDGTGVKGITVNENIWYSAVWIFWVNLWDSTDLESPFTGLQSFDLSPVVGKYWLEDDGSIHSTLKLAPWHVCAQTQGLQFRFKVWTNDEAEPTWDDPVHVFSTILPDGWDYAGYSGGYAGHVMAGQTAVFSGQTAVPLCLAADMIATDYCQSLTTPTTTAPPSTSEPSTTPPPTTGPSTSEPSTTTGPGPGAGQNS